LQFLNGRAELAFLSQSLAHFEMRNGKLGVQIQGLLTLLNRFVVPARREQNFSHIGTDDQR
jgi:hypothetical protein